MKVAVVGSGGQLGQALRRLAPSGVGLHCLARAEMDVSVQESVNRVMQHTRPDVILNAAAYTQVDQAESDEPGAQRVNAEGPVFLAEAARAIGARLIHVSTDFVFAGDRAVPYEAEAARAPLNAYGRTKLAGELAVQRILGDRAVILRTSWLYAAHGRNFVLTMLRLMATRESIGVVFDQVGSPTWADSLADAVWAIVQDPSINGPQHWCDAGVASWFDFAVAIQEEAVIRGLLTRVIPIRAIGTEDYPTPARRPRYSVLDTRRTAGLLGRAPAHWRQNLRKMLDELAAT